MHVPARKFFKAKMPLPARMPDSRRQISQFHLIVLKLSTVLCHGLYNRSRLLHSSSVLGLLCDGTGDTEGAAAAAAAVAAIAGRAAA